MKQIETVEEILNWLKTSPVDFIMTSIQGGAVHVKFLIPEVINTPMRKQEEDQKDVWTPIKIYCLPLDRVNSPL